MGTGLSELGAVEHRGRVQAQGGSIEESEPWDRRDPPTVADGHAKLDAVRSRLSDRERAFRDSAFDQAHRAVDRAGDVGGVPQDSRYPWRKSYPEPARADGRRVDLEVHSGIAFVPGGAE